jgi:TolA-binding protein
MKNQVRNINNIPRMNGSVNDPLSRVNDLALFETIGEYMKGWLDQEDVKNDPAFSIANKAVDTMMTDYNRCIEGNKENEKFIREILSSVANTDTIEDELAGIRKEISDNKLNEITSEWVQEWHKKKQMIGVADPKSEEIKNFISSSINSPAIEEKNTEMKGGTKTIRRRLFARYVSLSAAALIGAFIVIRTLLPSSDPVKLYNSYYKPFDAISPVTRSIGNTESDKYSSAIASYKTGNYQQAAMGFAELLEKDQYVVASQFFLGLSQLALNNNEQAINLLTGVANGKGEYAKESRWYLGIAYLKTADKQKAEECFKSLSGVDGYYKVRSEKILRRLK